MLKAIKKFYYWLFDIKTSEPVTSVYYQEPKLETRSWHTKPIVAAAPMETPAPKKSAYRMTYREWVENNRKLDQLRTQ